MNPTGNPTSYFARTLIKEPTFDAFLKRDSDINNHAGGPDAIRDAKGYFGYIATDTKTVPPDGNEKNLFLDNRVVGQWTDNNGDRDLAIVKEKPLVPGKFDIIDAHHGFPTSRHIGVPRLPAIILDDKGPYLKDAYTMMKNGTMQPVNIVGGIPLEQQVQNVNKVPGELSIPPERTKEVAPEFASGQGKQKVQSLIDQANKNKPALDSHFGALAKKTGTTFESRVKKPSTMVRKIVQHRIEGQKEYDEKGVNDVYGGRFVTKSPMQKNMIIKALNQQHRDGKLKIEKQQQVNKDTYHAFHMDIHKNGVRGELQIHDPQSQLEAVANHQIRAQAGEKPPPALDKAKKLNAMAAQRMPAQAAVVLAHGIEEERRKNG